MSKGPSLVISPCQLGGIAQYSSLLTLDPGLKVGRFANVSYLSLTLPEIPFSYKKDLSDETSPRSLHHAQQRSLLTTNDLVGL